MNHDMTNVTCRMSTKPIDGKNVIHSLIVVTPQACTNVLLGNIVILLNARKFSFL